MNEKYISMHETRYSINEPIAMLYKYGSSVYGCTTNKSDNDYIAVVRSENDLYYSVNKDDSDFTVYSESIFIKRIKEHHISALECIFQHQTDPFVKHFQLNLELLRREISSVSSNSFVKCKKKLAQGEDYIGKKSMFHSLRILAFGIQIAKYGKIVDYSEMNHLLYMIMEMDNWNDINNLCKPMFNSMKTQFKLLAPLESDDK